MRGGPGIALMVLGLMTTAAAATPSDHRLVVIVGEPRDPRAATQHELLARHAAALSNRDVLVQDITPRAARRARPELGVGAKAAFEVLLVGKDGRVKMRRFRPVPASEIIALIDAMPMRQEEMRHR